MPNVIMKNFKVYSVTLSGGLSEVLGIGETFAIGKLTFMSETLTPAGGGGQFQMPAMGVVQAVTTTVPMEYFPARVGQYLGMNGQINWYVRAAKVIDGDTFNVISEVPVISRIKGMLLGFGPGLAGGVAKAQKGELDISVSDVQIMEGAIPILSWGIGRTEFIYGGRDFNLITRAITG